MKLRPTLAIAGALCCATPAFAQNLSRVQTIALQQQLRDDGCGVTHISGQMDAMTRSAVNKCKSKYAGATDASSMLVAMNVGFSANDMAPSMRTAKGSGTSGSMGMSDSAGMSMRHGTRARTRMMHDSSSAMNNGRMNGGSMNGGSMNNGSMRDSTMMGDSTHMGRGMRSGRRMRDTSQAMRDSMRMRRDTMQNGAMSTPPPSNLKHP